jgi:hypothetical protein
MEPIRYSLDLAPTSSGQYITLGFFPTASGEFRRMRCFRSLLLVTYPHLPPTKALVPDLEPTRIGDAKSGCKVL